MWISLWFSERPRVIHGKSWRFRSRNSLVLPHTSCLRALRSCMPCAEQYVVHQKAGFHILLSRMFVSLVFFHKGSTQIISPCLQEQTCIDPCILPPERIKPSALFHFGISMHKAWRSSYINKFSTTMMHVHTLCASSHQALSNSSPFCLRQA